MNTVKTTEVKSAADIVGDWGPWQRNLLIFFSITYIVSAFQNLGIVFYAPKINFWCAEPDENQNLTNSIIAFSNFTNGNGSKEHRFIDDRCLSNQDPNKECKKWEYDLSTFKSTIIDEFDLICSRSWMASISASAFQFGYIISSIFFGYISDRFGRMFSFKIAVFLEILSGFSQAFSFSIYQFIISRLFLGVAAYGRYLSGLLLVLECVGTKYRAQVLAVTEVGFAVGYMLLPGVAYLIPHFRYIQVIATSYQIITSLYMWRVQESPRWQLTHNKFRDAENEITKAAKMKGKLSEAEVHSRLRLLHDHVIREEERLKVARKQTLLDLWKVPLLLKYCIVLYISWFVNSFVYYGISLNLSDLGGNLFLNCFIYGVAELLSTIFLYFAFPRLKRRLLLLFLMLGIGISCLSIALFLWYDFAVNIRIVIAMFGKFCITSSYRVIYLQAAEIIPTTLRQIGVGSCSIAARIGSVIAPFMRELSESTHPAVTMILFGCFAVSDGVLALILPETKNSDIPDTIYEAVRIKKRSKSNKKEVVSFLTSSNQVTA